MQYFPIFADLKGALCLVVGETQGAADKADLLERAGASVRRLSEFEPIEATEAQIIVADVEEAQARRISDFGKARRILVNIVDKPGLCTFIVPAIVERGDLVVAVSTSGRSPALSGWIRRRLQRIFGAEYQTLLEVFSATRREVIRLVPRYRDRKELYYRLLDQGILEVARLDGPEEVEARLRRELEGVRNAGRL